MITIGRASVVRTPGCSFDSNRRRVELMAIKCAFLTQFVVARDVEWLTLISLKCKKGSANRHKNNLFVNF